MLSANRTVRVSIALRKLAVVIAAFVLAVACSQPEVDYRAADVRLALAVRAQLDARADTKGAASRVVIEAKDGTVTLTGSVDTPQDKALLEQTVGRTNGVKSVVNQVTVNMAVLPIPDEPFEEQAVRREADSNGERIGRSHDDARIYHAIRRQVVRHETTPKRAIFVDVEDGDVTLRGTIFTGAARDDAVASAKKVPGVKAVRDLLIINTQLP